MEPIFDRSGGTVAWLDNDVIRDRAGRAVAFIPRHTSSQQAAVYSYAPEHLGYLGDGFFRDIKGDAVAFLASHAHGPITPIPGLPPLPPLPAIAALPPFAPLPPIAPLPTYNWSRLCWADFVEGQG
jgi:4-fold beta flower protein